MTKPQSLTVLKIHVELTSESGICMAFCVMVKGPCRGRMCDFWARVKIKKSTLEELVTGIEDSIINLQKENSLSFNEAVRVYWSQLGVRDINRLGMEEPELLEKMKRAEVIAHNHFL